MGAVSPHPSSLSSPALLFPVAKHGQKPLTVTQISLHSIPAVTLSLSQWRKGTNPGPVPPSPFRRKEVT